ncbi:MAG: alkyl hydroperoxide reductase [Salibacteraceae bacterium]
MMDFSPPWMSTVLRIAGVYNLSWGAAVIFFPNFFFELAEMETPAYPMIWQCVGMIVGVYGIGYLAAATQPYRHWPITLVGFLGKVFGPIGFAWYLAEGAFPLNWGLIIVFNDLVWWLPFGLILWGAWKSRPKAQQLYH